MKNKEIQESRMRQHFISATKQLLKGEGIQAVSVRNVATQAGYSFATIYNYFRDVNDLIFYCVSDFQDEIRKYVADKTGTMPDGKEKLKATVLAYMGYFIEYPGIFDLFYLARVTDFGSRQPTIDVIGNSLEDICSDQWKYCTDNRLLITGGKSFGLSGIQLMVLGLLLLYLNRRIPEDYADFISRAEEQVDSILEKYKAG